jgi:hypothetical protein
MCCPPGFEERAGVTRVPAVGHGTSPMAQMAGKKVTSWNFSCIVKDGEMENPDAQRDVSFVGRWGTNLFQAKEER